MGGLIMTNIFEYTNFRIYLDEWYEAKKRNNPNFSFQHIADKAGIKNKGFIYNIIKGDKLLSKSNVFKISKALGHNRYEAEYFENLVAFNQAIDLTEKKYLFEKLSQITNMGKTVSKAQVLRKDQYEYYSNWYHAMIRSIIGMYGFRDDYKWLSRMINPPITVPQAKHSVQLLEKLQLILKDDQGIYRLSHNNLTTGKDLMSVAFQNFHSACTDLAKRAITEFPLEKRNMTGLTLGISEKTYERICKEIEVFQEKIMGIAEVDETADRVYQLSFHLFPTSNNDQQRKQA
jgi:uncharacterized protein (TIGR02147 family)